MTERRIRERAITLSGLEARAIVEGRQTQVCIPVSAHQVEVADICTEATWNAQKAHQAMAVPPFRFLDAQGRAFALPPYANVGDRLWGREAWRTAESLDERSPSAMGEMCLDAGYSKPWAPLLYEADGHRNSEWRGFGLRPEDARPGKLRPSTHMPRWASRIVLEVTALRVERLHGISEADARAQGAPCVDEFTGREVLFPDACNAGSWRLGHRVLWEKIHGPSAWRSNPLVWCISFRKISP